ncbi:hypothetical protein Tco_0013719 [Tanacetum coccineum]
MTGESQLYVVFERFCQIKGVRVDTMRINQGRPFLRNYNSSGNVRLGTGWRSDEQSWQCENPGFRSTSKTKMLLMNDHSNANTPFEVQAHDNFVDHMDCFMKYTEMQRDDYNTTPLLTLMLDYTSDSNIIPLCSVRG